MDKIINKAKKICKSYIYETNQKYFSNYVFIHINKCGGTSIEKFLGIQKRHETAQEVLERIGLRRWNEIYSFSIVRHPYSKVISHYKYRKYTNQTNINDKNIDVNTWIKLSYGDKKKEFYDIPLMFAPCLQWITLNKKIIVSRIIKLETLNAEWESVCSEIKRPYSPLPHANKTSSNNIESAFNQLDNESLGIIRHHFREDFEKLDYKY